MGRYLVVLLTLCAVLLGAAGYWSYRSQWEAAAKATFWVATHVEDLGRIIEIVKEVQQVDRDGDGRLEYVGWGDYVQSVASARAQNLGLTLGVEMEGIQRAFILSEVSDSVGVFQVQKGMHVADGYPYYQLALFFPRQPDRAEQNCIVIGWTHERRWAYPPRSFLVMSTPGGPGFWYRSRYTTKKMPLTWVKGVGVVPAIGQLGRFEGDTWQPDEEFWGK